MGRGRYTSTAVMHAHAVPTLYYYILCIGSRRAHLLYNVIIVIIVIIIVITIRYPPLFKNIFLFPSRTGRQHNTTLAIVYNNTAEFFLSFFFCRITMRCVQFKRLHQVASCIHYIELVVDAVLSSSYR